MPDVEVGDVVITTGVPVETAGSGGAPVVQGTLTRENSMQIMEARAREMTAAPTAESKQKTVGQIFKHAFGGWLMPVIFLLCYSGQGWGTQYCQTEIANWALISSCVALGGMLYAFLIEIWFWRIKWAAFSTTDEAGRATILRRKGLLQVPSFGVLIFSLVWFVIGQTRIWTTTGCADDVYARIASGAQPGCSYPQLPATDLSTAVCGTAASSDPVRMVRVSGTLDPDTVIPCCFNGLHQFARVYSIMVFVFLGIFAPCLCCMCCFFAGAASAKRRGGDTA